MKTTIKFTETFLIAAVTKIHEEIVNNGVETDPGYFLYDPADPATEAASAVPGQTPYINMLTTAGNLLRVHIFPEYIELTYEGRRHALWANGNVVGGLMKALFYNSNNEKWNDALIQSGEVISYNSARKDRPWYEVGLKPPRIPEPRFRTLKEMNEYLRQAPKSLRSLYREKAEAYMYATPEVCWNICGPRGFYEDIFS
ncbi:MAG: hypothetical protein DSY80_08485 [Desulfocapsa sp.]|nr:MAG: hypothetical protein DSY80_08485 [Desulfocapsa sp.]